MQSYAAIMVVIWPLGVPLLYAYGFWVEWPTISQLRRAKMRADSSQTLQALRRGSEKPLLQGELLATLHCEDGEAHAPMFDSVMSEVVLVHQRLMVTPPPAESTPLYLKLLPNDPQLIRGGEQLSVAVLLSSLDDDVARGAAFRAATLTLTLPARDSPRHLAAGATTRRSRRWSALSLGRTRITSLREWQSAIAMQRPESHLTAEDAEADVKQLHLGPIIWPYELRCTHRTYRLATRRATREWMRHEPRCERARCATSLAFFAGASTGKS